MSTNPFENVTEEQIRQWDHLYKDSEIIFEKPIVLKAEVVHGFKRGSKELGIPTANLSMDQLGELGENLNTGIYFGWTHLKDSVYPSVTSVGWNPYYKNIKKTIEVHILQPLDDFYDETISTVLCGYLRNETNFNNLG